MPSLGRRESDYLEMGISASADELPPTSPPEDRASRLVVRIAHDDDDRRLLLEALGLEPTVDVLAAAG